MRRIDPGSHQQLCRFRRSGRRLSPAKSCADPRWALGHCNAVTEPHDRRTIARAQLTHLHASTDHEMRRWDTRVAPQQPVNLASNRARDARSRGGVIPTSQPRSTRPDRAVLSQHDRERRELLRAPRGTRALNAHAARSCHMTNR